MSWSRHTDTEAMSCKYTVVINGTVRCWIINNGIMVMVWRWINSTFYECAYLQGNIFNILMWRTPENYV